MTAKKVHSIICKIIFFKLDYIALFSVHGVYLLLISKCFQQNVQVRKDLLNIVFKFLQSTHPARYFSRIEYDLKMGHFCRNCMFSIHCELTAILTLSIDRRH